MTTTSKSLNSLLDNYISKLKFNNYNQLLIDTYNDRLAVECIRKIFSNEVSDALQRRNFDMFEENFDNNYFKPIFVNYKYKNKNCNYYYGSIIDLSLLKVYILINYFELENENDNNTLLNLYRLLSKNYIATNGSSSMDIKYKKYNFIYYIFNCILFDLTYNMSVLKLKKNKLPKQYIKNYEEIETINNYEMFENLFIKEEITRILKNLYKFKIPFVIVDKKFIALNTFLDDEDYKKMKQKLNLFPCKINSMIYQIFGEKPEYLIIDKEQWGILPFSNIKCCAKTDSKEVLKDNKKYLLEYYEKEMIEMFI
jgi:hypothetical protein